MGVGWRAVSIVSACPPSHSAGIAIVLRVRVAHVLEDSPFKGMIKKDDEIIAVNGVEVKDAREAGARLTPPPQVVALARAFEERREERLNATASHRGDVNKFELYIYIYIYIYYGDLYFVFLPGNH